MTNIAKCENKMCQKKQTCFRYMSKADEYWQSYGSFGPDKTGKCDFYWPFICDSCGKKGEHTEECKLTKDV